MAAPKFNASELQSIVQAFVELNTHMRSLGSAQPFNAAIDGMLQLRAAFKSAMDALGKNDALSGLASQVINLRTALAEVYDRMAKLPKVSANAEEFARWTKEAQRLQEAIGGVEEDIKKLRGGGFDFAGLAKGYSKSGTLGGFAEGIQGGGAGAAGAVAGGIVAAGDLIIEGFKKVYASTLDIVSVSSKFVATAAPGLVDRLNLAFQDLSSAIGTTLVPIVQQFILVLDYVNSVVTRFQEALIPIVESNWTIFTEIIGYFVQFGSVLAQSLLPVLVAFTEVVKILWGVIQPLVEVFLQLAKDVLPSLVNGMLTAIATVIGILLPALIALNLPLVTLIAAVTAAAVAFNAVIGAVKGFIAGIKQGFEKPGELLGSIWKGIKNQFSGKKSSLEQEGPITVFRKPEIIETEEIGKQARLAAYGSRSIAEQQLQVQRQIEANTRPNPAPPGQPGQPDLPNVG